MDDATDEPNWHPPPPQNDDWEKPWVRARHVLMLHGMAVTFAVLMFGSRLISPAMVGRFLLCAVPGFLLCWVGLVVQVLVLRFEARTGGSAKGGQNLVLSLDLLTVLLLVFGAFFWGAMLAL